MCWYFFQPYWLGSSEKSPGAGVFGLYQYCTYDRTSEMSIEKCSGELSAFDVSVLTVYFKAATILIGVSALIILLCIACMLLFFFVSAKTVYILCGCLQFTSFLCILTGCIVFPAGWDHPQVMAVCGHTTSKYNRGSCELRWTYILALIGIFDAFFLSILAFILGTKQVKMLPSSTNGDTNLAYSPGYPSGGHNMISGMEPHDGRMSQFSVTHPSNRSKAEYASSVQNFQL